MTFQSLKYYFPAYKLHIGKNKRKEKIERPMKVYLSNSEKRIRYKVPYVDRVM